ncbi:MAG: bifunctional metallophosphatase/5'-nucleotidase [Bdellovibrionales bacterium]|nr:bifunctional metallophosphatase/5'-nucleotidase [Bdellovibrionales bacterium]
MNFLKLALTIFCVGLTTSASAKLIQIIHTNDLHSFFEGSRSGKGGYSRIKTLVDQLKADAETKGIRTLFLDAGDFGEGSSYYFSNKGTDALRALDLLGVDVTVLGNHDFIMGGHDLARQLKESNLQANLLSANLKGKALMRLRHKIKEHVDFDIDGMKIRIFGLTTPEIHYQYPLLPQGFIGPSHKKGINIAQRSKQDGVDFLIALTHIGLDKDSTLVSHSRSIDMVIGGHSHTRLEQPKMVENLNGEIIPIFQTGAHGLAVGSLIVDVLGDGEYKMIDYRLYDVTQELAQDTEVKKFVDEAYVNRERYFNRTWNEVIGFSEINLSGLYHGRVKDPRSCWSKHIARLTRQTAESDISIQFDLFQGEEIPKGEIRFGDLIDNFPHFRAWGDQGWSINRSYVSGLVLNQVLKYLGAGDQPFDATIDGVQAWDIDKNEAVAYISGFHKPEDALINGQSIKNLQFYSVALPSEIPYAMGKMLPGIADILLVKATPVPDSNFWPLFEDYIARNSPLKCIED